MKRDQIKRFLALFCVMTMLFGNMPATVLAETNAELLERVRTLMNNRQSESADVPADLVAVHAGEHQVEKDKVGGKAAEGCQRVDPVLNAFGL